jgi:hypothetical protein
MDDHEHVPKGKSFNPGLSDIGENEEAQVPAHITERKLMAKIDLRVMPCLCILYVLTFLDR